MIKANNLIKQFMGEIPAFLCTADGTINFENKSAETLFKGRIFGEKISKYLSAYDALCFEFSLQSKKPRPFTAAAKLISGNYHLAVLPFSIGFSSFAIVLAYKSEADAESIINGSCQYSRNEITEFVHELIKRGIDINYQDTVKALFDPLKTIEKLAGDLSHCKRISLEFETHKFKSDQEIIASDMGLYSFVNLFIFSTHIINQITSSGKMDITIIPAGSAFEMQMETHILQPIFGEGCDALASKHPSCGFALTMLEFMAATARCELTVYCKGHTVVISIISKEITEHIDFKSYDQFTEYSHILADALTRFDAICTEAVQASK